ncbi:MAG: ATP-binding protein [Caldilinea sp. CFX5]|nr:ATP-binding protein [Caldilinea sp. CFX5]
MFVDRERELKALNQLLQRPGAQFVITYGRRRVGKTTLLLEWAKRSNTPFIYWVAAREPSALLLRTFSQAIYQRIQPSQARDPLFTYSTWGTALRAAATLATNQRLILIIDEFPYAAEAEPALTSLLQNAWDHEFKQIQIVLVLAGSQVGMMVELLSYRAPLYGRTTAQLALKPLPFRALIQFYPQYTAEQRVAVYAILGGIPAYLEKFSDDVNLATNVRDVILSPLSIFQHEPLFLLQDEVREPANYLAIIRAIGEGARTLDEIALQSGLAKNHASTYLARLQELTFIRREMPVTLPKGKRTTQGRYVLDDAYLRFYFRFLAANRVLLEQGLLNRLWELISEGLRAFVGQTAFEEICRTWVLEQAIAGRLSFIPDAVGRHWSTDCEIDVVAINWRERKILLGECKWGANLVGVEVIRSLIEERGPRVLARLGEEGWQITYAFFARTGFTAAAQERAAVDGALLLNLQTIDMDLSLTPS